MSWNLQYGPLEISSGRGAPDMRDRHAKAEYAMNGLPLKTVTGLVMSIDISNLGTSAPQLELAIMPPGKPAEIYVMELDAAPQMFAAAAMLCTAHTRQVPVTITVLGRQDHMEKPRICGIRLGVYGMGRTS